MASSPVATSRTTPTGRPSPPPDRDAWPPSTPNGGWKPSTTVEIGPRGVRDEERARGGCISTIVHPKGRTLMAHGIQTLTSSTFDETVQAASEPVIVDFWAEWCGPCKMIAPILEEIAAEQDGKVTVAKLNVDEHPDLARRYDVMSIPTLLVFHEGELRKRLIGAKGKGQLLEELNEFLPTGSR